MAKITRKEVQLTVRVPPSLAETITATAAKDGVTVAAWLREAAVQRIHGEDLVAAIVPHIGVGVADIKRALVGLGDVFNQLSQQVDAIRKEMAKTKGEN